jgi:integrase
MTALAVIIEPGADLAVDFAGERASAEEAALNALSPATRAAYATDWRAFTDWCRARAYEPLPAAPAVIAMYLPACAKTLAAASIGRRIAAIAHYHEAAGHPSPMAHPIVKATWKGVRRTIGIAQKGKSALTIDGLRPLVAGFGARRIDVRDRALLLLGFGAALRRSEIVALDVGDLAFVPEGRVRPHPALQDGPGRRRRSARRPVRLEPRHLPGARAAGVDRAARRRLTRRAAVRRAQPAFADRRAALRPGRRAHRCAPVRRGRPFRRLLRSFDARRVRHDGRGERRRCVGNLKSDPAQVARYGQTLFAPGDDLEVERCFPRGDVI